MATIDHPWQKGPTELIKHALEHLQRSSDFDQRVAFLLLDVGVETLFKTFLTLPSDVTKAQGSHSERLRASRGSFHDLAHGVREAAGHRFKETDLHYVQYYHTLRNKLYHDGEGIVVSKENTQRYALLVVDLLRKLLDVDLKDEQRRLNLEVKYGTTLAKLAQQVEEIREARQRLEQEVELAIEQTVPKLLFPSFVRQFDMIAEDARAIPPRISGQECTQKLVDLLNACIDDPYIKACLFADEGVEEVIGLGISDGTSDLMSFYLKILTILIRPPQFAAPDDFTYWEDSHVLSRFYPDNELDPDSVVVGLASQIGEEPELSEVIDVGKGLVKDLNDAREAILIWLQSLEMHKLRWTIGRLREGSTE